MMRKTMGMICVLMLAWGVVGCGKKQEAAKPETPGGSAPAAATAIDPVCGMEVKTAAASKVEYKGKTYYFCSDGDKAQFEADPAKYVKSGE